MKITGKEYFGKGCLTLITMFLQIISLPRFARMVSVSEPDIHILIAPKANFTPYTYAPLVLASTSVCQHVANIFIFLSVFLRLKENTSNPRLIVWLAILLFFIGYVSWEVIHYTQGIALSRDSSKQLHNLYYKV